jgi:hypothetical protein
MRRCITYGRSGTLPPALTTTGVIVTEPTTIEWTLTTLTSVNTSELVKAIVDGSLDIDLAVNLVQPPYQRPTREDGRRKGRLSREDLEEQNRIDNLRALLRGLLDREVQQDRLDKEREREDELLRLTHKGQTTALKEEVSGLRTERDGLLYSVSALESRVGGLIDFDGLHRGTYSMVARIARALDTDQVDLYSQPRSWIVAGVIGQCEVKFEYPRPGAMISDGRGGQILAPGLLTISGPARNGREVTMLLKLTMVGVVRLDDEDVRALAETFGPKPKPRLHGADCPTLHVMGVPNSGLEDEIRQTFLGGSYGPAIQDLLERGMCLVVWPGMSPDQLQRAIQHAEEVFTAGLTLLAGVADAASGSSGSRRAPAGGFPGNGSPFAGGQRFILLEELLALNH